MDIESKDLDNIRKYLIHEIEEYEVYESAKYLCYHNRQKEIIDLITRHYATYVEHIERLMDVEEDSILFDMTIELWIKFKNQLVQTKEVLKYLDIKIPLEPLILTQILNLITPQVESRLQKVVLQEIMLFRTSNLETPPLQLIDLLLQLQSFHKFELQYLSELFEFYKIFTEIDLYKQIKLGNQIYKREVMLQSNFPQEFKTKIMDILHEQVFKKINLVDLDDLYFNQEAMKEIYQFCKDTNHLSQFRSGFRKYVNKEAKIKIMMPPHELLNHLLALDTQCSKIINTILEDSDHQIIRKHAIEDAAYEFSQKFSYSLCYVINPQDLAYFSKSIELLKYMPDKEDFQTYYLQFLIKRIIQNNYDQHELDLIKQLIPYCNSDWIDQCNALLESAKDSIDVNSKFMAYCNRKKIMPKFQTNFLLIPQQSWPYEIIHTPLPNPLNRIAQQFLKFKSEDQSLNFLLQQQSSIIVLKVNLSIPFEIQVSQKQAIELLQFNEGELVTTITDAQQYNGLIMIQNGQYKINRNYKAKQTLEIIEEQIQIKQEKNAKQINDYLYVVDAVIIKIIKTIKNCSITQLIEKTIENIKKNYPKFIDLAEEEIVYKQIDGLVGKEYLQRNNNQIEYI